MLDLLSNRLQKSMGKMKAKLTLSEADLLEVTREIKIALLEADVNLQVVKAFIEAVKVKAIGAAIVGKLNPGQQMIKIVRDELVIVLGETVRELKLQSNPSVIMLVGLQGSGKTTTAAKMAKLLVRKNHATKPLLVAADIYRPAAIEQLITLGKELAMPVFALGTSVSPQEIVKQALIQAKQEKHDLVIIDTAGRLSIDEKLMQELVELKAIAKPEAILFVTDALAGQDIINVATSFDEKLNLSGFIITKLDSDARGGAALSLRFLLKKPIWLIGTGERTSAIDSFYPDRMAERILGMGDVLSLIEKAEEVVDEKQSKRVLNRMMTGQFDLNDLIDQLQQMKKIGKMSKLLKMVPGAAAKVNEAQLESADVRLDLYLVIMNSMTKTERKNPRLLKDASRKQRIMRGSGRSTQEYNQLVNEFDRMKKQMVEMAKAMKKGSFGA